jgi:hypothetical protein
MLIGRTARQPWLPVVAWGLIPRGLVYLALFGEA